jgi:hypothetical protein
MVRRNQSQSTSRNGFGRDARNDRPEACATQRILKTLHQQNYFPGDCKCSTIARRADKKSVLAENPAAGSGVKRLAAVGIAARMLASIRS